MPQYDDPLWTVIAFAVILLVGLWAYGRRDQNSGATRTTNSTEPEINRPTAAETESAPNENETGNSRGDRYDTERTIRNWTAVLAISGVFAAIFAAFTLNAIRGQLDEMRNDRRAWVGPVTAGFQKGGPEVGKDIIATVQYHNTGRDPAINTFADLAPYVVTLADDKAGITASHVADYVAKCRETAPGAAVTFPTTGFSSYTISRLIEGGLIDWNTLYGTSLIILTGCFVYDTLGARHHTSFCYYFQNSHMILPQSWPFCPSGNYAD